METLFDELHPSWRSRLEEELRTPYIGDLTHFIAREYADGAVYPNPENILRAFNLCPFEDVRVVILGQDPYHGPGQANGLCFAVDEGVALPPSLKNIYKEIESDFGRPLVHRSGDLIRWARQGVLLLNATLTVRERQPASHKGRGWEKFTDAAVACLSRARERLVFLLWGAHARDKGGQVDQTKHCVLTAGHPSPLSARSFFGCRHFSKANAWLETHGTAPIDWL